MSWLVAHSRLPAKHFHHDSVRTFFEARTMIADGKGAHVYVIQNTATMSGWSVKMKLMPSGRIKLLLIA